MADAYTLDALPKVTRVEVVDSTGRAFVGYYKNVGVTVSMQDDDQTIKIFAGERIDSYEWTKTHEIQSGWLSNG